MASGVLKEVSTNDLQEAFFDEAACLIDDSPMEHSLPEAGKTATTPEEGKNLAAKVDGGSEDLGRYSTPVSVHPARGYIKHINTSQ